MYLPHTIPNSQDFCRKCGIGLYPIDTVLSCTACNGSFCSQCSAMGGACPICQLSPYAICTVAPRRQGSAVPTLPAGSVQASVDKLKQMSSVPYDKSRYPHKCVVCASDAYDDGCFRVLCTNPKCSNLDPALK